MYEEEDSNRLPDGSKDFGRKRGLVKPTKPIARIYEQLRDHFDGDEPFVNKGFEIKKARTDYPRYVPAWTLNNEKVCGVLSEVFPRMEERTGIGRHQRQSARLWATIIIWYFRLKFSVGQIMTKQRETFGHPRMSRSAIKSLLKRIRLAGEGLTTAGRIRTNKPRGRPRGKVETQPRKPRSHGIGVTIKLLQTKGNKELSTPSVLPLGEENTSQAATGGDFILPESKK